MDQELANDWLTVPGATRFPVELRPPAGFRPEDPATWPRVDGRLEYVGGKLLYMPPCGEIQQDVVPAIVHALFAWRQAHPDFVVASNEAGIIFGRDVRGADAAVWRRADVGPTTQHKYRRVPPLLAVEVSGRDEGETELRDKARYYLDAGVAVVWLVLADSREVVVMTRDAETRHGPGDRLAAHEVLPDLAPAVADLFAQLD